MGTEVQSKMYLPRPGYYTIRDVDDNLVNGNMNIHHESRAMKNGVKYLFMTSPSVEEYFGHNKQHMKQSILSHEVTFKHQCGNMMARKTQSCKGANTLISAATPPSRFKSTKTETRRWSSQDQSLTISSVRLRVTEKGQKLIVVVLTPRKHIAPAPSPVEFDGPSVAPSPMRGRGVSL